MRILQLCNKPPRPIVDGGCIAMNAISEGLLKSGHAVDILSVSTHKHAFDLSAFDLPLFQNSKIDSVFIDTKTNLVDAFSAMMSSDSYNVNRFFSSDFDFELIRWLSDKSYDIIHLESLFMTPYIPTIRKLSQGKIVLRSHNLEHLIWQRMAHSAGISPKKLYLKHLASRLKKHETKVINEVDGVAAISSKDLENFKELKCTQPLKSIPFSTELDQFKLTLRSNISKIRFFHIGTMNWTPNIEAVNYLMNDIWPRISALNIELHLAGRGMQSNFIEMSHENLHIQGEVPSVVDFMAENDVLIVPLLSGSGIRVKIIEGMAMGKTILTTSIGAEGIPYTNWENIIIANTPAEFEEAIKKLIASPTIINTIGKAARILVEENFDSKKVIDDLIKFYNSI